MIATSLAAHSPRAVREVLLARGWNAPHAEAAALSLEPVVLHLTELPEPALEALVRQRAGLGLELLTGDGWAIVAGSRSKLAVLARPGVLPAELTAVASAVAGALPAEPAEVWLTATGPIALDHPIILGILNVTPDSFSDGGRYATLDGALAHAEVLAGAGADLIDVGGESTRPGSVAVSEDEELRRVIPVVELLVRRLPRTLVSVDTVKSAVARSALAVGAAVINDVSGLRLDPAMAEVIVTGGAGVVLMHSRGGVSTMASTQDARYGPDPVSTILQELRQRSEVARGAGIPDAAIVVDPGFGFAKTVEQNLMLLDRLAAVTVLGYPVLVGPSRKRFLGAATGQPLEQRDQATAAACVMAYERGARLFRVHDVAWAKEALDFAGAVRGER